MSADALITQFLRAAKAAQDRAGDLALCDGITCLADALSGRRTPSSLDGWQNRIARLRNPHLRGKEMLHAQAGIKLSDLTRPVVTEVIRHCKDAPPENLLTRGAEDLAKVVLPITHSSLQHLMRDRCACLSVLAGELTDDGQRIDLIVRLCEVPPKVAQKCKRLPTVLFRRHVLEDQPLELALPDGTTRQISLCRMSASQLAQAVKTWPNWSSQESSLRTLAQQREHLAGKGAQKRKYDLEICGYPKYAGKPWSWVAENDADYIRYLLTDDDCTATTHRLAEALLEKYPAIIPEICNLPKWEGKSWSWVVSNDLDYVRWLASDENPSQGAQRLARLILRFRERDPHELGGRETNP